MRFLYSLALLLLMPVAFPWFMWRSLRQTGTPDKWGERLGSSPYLHPGVAIWVHGASVGEIRAAAPLVQALHKKYPDRPILVTTFSGTGRRQARQLFGDTVVVSLMPYDLPFCVSRWLNCTKPALALILETELWPNLFAACAKRNIPVCLVSARLSARGFERYRKHPSLWRNTLDWTETIAVQTSADAERFRALGADEKKLTVMGNLKFDVRVTDETVTAGAKLREKLFGGARVWVAGSSRDGEEPVLLEAFRRVLARQPETVLVIAPRHPERADAVAKQVEGAGFICHRRSRGDVKVNPGEVLLVDLLGQLMKFYAAGDVAFVGGSLVPVGGHNLLEPAALGLPVLAGPNLENVQDVAQMMLDAGVLRITPDAGALADAVDWLLGNPAMRQSIGEVARSAVDANRGARDRVMDMVAKQLRRK